MKRHNSSYLSILLLGLLICLIKVLISPTHNKRTAVTLLPSSPMMPMKWSLQRQELIAPSHLSEQYNYLVAGRKYAFSNDEHQFLLELREISNVNGDVKTLQAKYTGNSLSSAFEIKQTHKGEYYLSQQLDQVEFQTCLYRSHFSVTSEVFRKQAYREIFQPQHLQDWFLGNRALVNDRCLWVKATVKPAISIEKIESLLAEMALTHIQSSP